MHAGLTLASRHADAVGMWKCMMTMVLLMQHLEMHMTCICAQWNAYLRMSTFRFALGSEVKM